MRWRRAALCVALFVFVRGAVVDWHRVSGRSMTPTLLPGDMIVCDRLAYGFRLPGMKRPLVAWSAPQPGDVVIVSSPRTGGRCVKRVADKPGLAPGELWLLGDASDRSVDSRQWGTISADAIEGRATILLFSLDRSLGWLPRRDRIATPIPATADSSPRGGVAE